jgi:hypothetical protein
MKNFKPGIIRKEQGFPRINQIVTPFWLGPSGVLYPAACSQPFLSLTMADQNPQQQQQQRTSSRPTWDERLVACVMRIWKVEHDSAERVLTNLSTIMEAAQKEQDPGKRDTMIVSYLCIAGMSLGILGLNCGRKIQQWSNM